MTDRITINGVTYSRTVPATGTSSCEGCVANGPNAEEGTELCQAITFALNCGIRDNMWEIAKPEPKVKRVECWALVTKEGVFTCPEATSDEYVWGYYLYRTEEDIEEAKARGDRVCLVIVEIPE